MQLITKRHVCGGGGNRHQNGDFKEVFLADSYLRCGGRGGGGHEFAPWRVLIFYSSTVLLVLLAGASLSEV